MLAVVPTTTWYLLLAAGLFSIGVVGVLVRRNPLVMFMCIELMLNAVNLTFVAFAERLGDVGGQTTVFFVMVVAAAGVSDGDGAALVAGVSDGAADVVGAAEVVADSDALVVTLVIGVSIGAPASAPGVGGVSTVSIM